MTRAPEPTLTVLAPAELAGTAIPPDDAETLLTGLYKHPVRPDPGYLRAGMVSHQDGAAHGLDGSPQYITSPAALRGFRGRSEEHQCELQAIITTV